MIYPEFTAERNLVFNAGKTQLMFSSTQIHCGW